MPQDTQEKIIDVKVNYNDAINAIAELKGRLQDVSKAQQTLNEQLKNGSMTQEEYNKAFAATKIEADNYKSSIRDIEKIVKNQIKTEKEEQGSLKQLRAELSNATAAYDSLSRAERNSAKGKDLQKHINEITKELKTAEEATQRYYRNVGNYENAIKSALGINSKWANSILSLGKEIQAAGGFMQMAKGQIEAFATSLKGLYANPIFLAIAGIAGAGMAFKWWVDYNTGLQEATKLTKEFTGKEGDDLKQYRNEVQAVADVYDKDFKEVLTTADTLAAQFGIDADEALQIMRDGFVAGADEQGNFLENLQKYPASFREAGLSASEFTAIVAQTKSGIFDESGLDAIKQANNRIRQMSSSTASALDSIGISSQKVLDDLRSGERSTMDVLQEVSQKLSELPPSSQEVGNTLVNVFGKQGRDAGLQMLETLADISTDLDEVKAKTGELGSLEEQQMQAQIDLNNAMSDLFDATGGTFEELKTQAIVFVKEGLAQIISGVKSVVDWFKNLYNQSAALRVILAAIGAAFKVSYDYIATLVNSVITYFKNLGEIIEGIFTLNWSKIKHGWTSQLNILGNSVKSFAKSAVKDISKVGDALKDPTKADASGNVKGNSGSGSNATSTSSTYSLDTSSVGAAGASSGGSTGGSSSTQQKQVDQTLQLAQKAEDELNKIIEDNLEKRRAQILTQYGRQIDDYKKKLEEDKTLTEQNRNDINAIIASLEIQRQRELQKLSDEEIQQQIKDQERLIQLRLRNVEQGSQEEYALRAERNEINRQKELDDTTLTEEMKQEINTYYDEQARQIEVERQVAEQEAELEAIDARYKVLFEAYADNEVKLTELMVEHAKERQDAIHQVEGEADEEYNARYEKENANRTKSQQKQSDAREKMQTAESDLYNNSVQGMIDITQQLGETNEAFAKLSKVLALGQIAVDTGVALAEGIKQAQSVGFPANIAAVATTVATIMANITTAISTVQSANFATGGLVTGEGTGTSDSIPAHLSNGESVITAQATGMFAPLLSTINQMGGGVPINVAESTSSQDGQEMLADAVAQGVSEMEVVVSVEEINKVNTKVKALERLGSV